MDRPVQATAWEFVEFPRRYRGDSWASKLTSHHVCSSRERIGLRRAVSPAIVDGITRLTCRATETRMTLDGSQLEVDGETHWRVSSERKGFANQHWILCLKQKGRLVGGT